MRAKINHPLHLMLALMTIGLWLVSWISICIGRIMRPWRCEHCGWHKPDFDQQHEKAVRAERLAPRPHHLIPAEPSRSRS